MNSTEATREKVAHLVNERVVEGIDGVIHGITFDGKRLILASGGSLFRLVPDTGRVVDQFETLPDRGGLAYDGRHFWQHSEGRVQKLDSRTGFVLRSLTPPLSEITGLECLGDDLLVLYAAGRKLARIETLDATPITDAEVNAPLRGLALVAGELWSSTAGSLCRVDPASGRVVAQFALPAGVEVCDLTGDAGGRLWCVDGGRQLLRAFVKPRLG